MSDKLSKRAMECLAFIDERDSADIHVLPWPTCRALWKRGLITSTEIFIVSRVRLTPKGVAALEGEKKP